MIIINFCIVIQAVGPFTFQQIAKIGKDNIRPGNEERPMLDALRSVFGSLSFIM